MGADGVRAKMNWHEAELCAVGKGQSIYSGPLYRFAAVTIIEALAALLTFLARRSVPVGNSVPSYM